MTRPAYILRALIRNDEALVEHYNGLIQGEPTLGLAERLDLLTRRAAVITRLHARRDSLSAALPPACTSRATNLNGDNSGPGTYAPEPSTAAR